MKRKGASNHSFIKACVPYVPYHAFTMYQTNAVEVWEAKKKDFHSTQCLISAQSFDIFKRIFRHRFTQELNRKADSLTLTKYSPLLDLLLLLEILVALGHPFEARMPSRFDLSY